MSNLKIKLQNVRLSFPSLFEPSEFNGQVGKYEATFLLNKDTDADQIKSIEKKIAGLLVEKKAKVPADKICLKDGDYVDYDGYENCMAIKGSNKRRPTVIDRDRSPLVEADGKPYSGCYVNAILELWFQDNSYGKRVNCNLLGVQFAKDGESFGAGATDVTNEFDEIEDFSDDIGF